jgi:hypothetical protein
MQFALSDVRIRKRFQQSETVSHLTDRGSVSRSNAANLEAADSMTFEGVEENKRAHYGGRALVLITILVMKSCIAITLLLSLCLLAPHAAKAQSTAKLSLAAIEGRSVNESSREPMDFVVLIENTSSRDIGIHRQWNSWGYYSIHFVVEGSDGKQTVIEKEPRGWNHNYPDCFRLSPGMTHAVPICFISKEWKGVEALSVKGAKLKAVFQQEPLEARENIWGSDFQIFTNKIESSFVAWDILNARKNN